MDSIGRRRWAIAEGWIPSQSTGPAPAMTSHETACLLNTGDRDAQVELTLFFKDREPVGPYRVTVWDTVEGRATGTSELSTCADGLLRVPLPPLRTDVAFAVSRRA